MESFDPLFDEDVSEMSSMRPFSLSLPTFDLPPPAVIEPPASVHERDLYFFDENVGAIALPGSQCSEHPPAPSLSSIVISQEQAQTRVTSKARRKATKKAKQPPKKRLTKKQIREQQPYQPATQNDMILGLLAKDPNIVPLLQAIVEYVYRTELRPKPQLVAPHPSLEQPIERPAKRRRLRKVPAGAEDWAIPFPFEQGEGPQHYKETWEMKRLMVLLGSLMRNLRDWKRQNGNISVNPHAPERIYRSRSKQGLVLDTGNDIGNLFNFDFLSTFDVPNPSGIDLSFENLIGAFNAYEQSGDSALNIDLGALSSGDSISQILYETSAASEQTVNWDEYMNLPSMVPDAQTDTSSTLFTPEASQEAQDVDMAEVAQLLNGMGNSTFDPFFWANFMNQGVAMEGVVPNPGEDLALQLYTEPSLDKQPQLDLSFPPLDILSQDEQAVPELGLQDMQDILDTLSAPTIEIPLPSMTPNDTPLSLMMPSPSIGTQMDVTMPTTAITNPALSVATLSKRGKGRSSQALRKDLNKQLRQNTVERTVALSSLPSTLNASTSKDASAKVKKVQISEKTLQEREETLARAKEWREMLAKQLENARIARWEAMMEGVVLREAGILMRNGLDNA